MSTTNLLAQPVRDQLRTQLAKHLSEADVIRALDLVETHPLFDLYRGVTTTDPEATRYSGGVGMLRNEKDGDITPRDLADFLDNKYTTCTYTDHVPLDGTGLALTAFVEMHEVDACECHRILLHRALA